MHHCCTFPGNNGPKCKGRFSSFLLCECVISILLRKLMIVDAVEVLC